MKILKAILKIAGGMFLLLVSAIVIMSLYAWIDRQDTFYLRNAQFSDYEFLSEMNANHENKDDRAPSDEMLNVYVHRISKGSGLIIAYRWYSNGNVMVIDDEGFKKLTIWLAKEPTAFPAKYNLSSIPDVKAAYIAGGSAWPRAACSGYIESGTMELEENGSTFVVKIRGTVDPAGSESFVGNCKKREIDFMFKASEIDYSELTPWLGLKGEHPYAETYR